MAHEDRAGKRFSEAHIDEGCCTTVSKNVDSFEMRFEDFPSLETGLANNTETTEQSRVSKRNSSMPRVYTPISIEDRLYCFCKNETDYGWYIKCSIQKKGCLVYYHPKCVNLQWMKLPEDAAMYSNCSDKRSYSCPIYSFKRTHESQQGIKDEVYKDANEPVKDDELYKCGESKEDAVVELGEEKEHEEGQENDDGDDNEDEYEYVYEDNNEQHSAAAADDDEDDDDAVVDDDNDDEYGDDDDTANADYVCHKPVGKIAHDQAYEVEEYGEHVEGTECQNEADNERKEDEHIQCRYKKFNKGEHMRTRELDKDEASKQTRVS